MQNDKTDNPYSPKATKNEEGITSEPAIEPECETKKVPLDPRIPDRTVMFSHGKPSIS
jgi:hypothetical protein